jgi:CHASE3 domain sensor protein
VTRSGRGWLDPAIGAALAGAAVLVLAVGLGALYEQWRGLRAGDQARETIRVLQQIARVKQLVTEAESGQRGYLITGDGRYLRPYDRALQAIPPALERLRTMTGDNPNQQAELDALEPLIAAKLEELRLTVGLR